MYNIRHIIVDSDVRAQQIGYKINRKELDYNYAITRIKNQPGAAYLHICVCEESYM